MGKPTFESLILFHVFWNQGDIIANVEFRVSG